MLIICLEYQSVLSDVCFQNVSYWMALEDKHCMSVEKNMCDVYSMFYLFPFLTEYFRSCFGTEEMPVPISCEYSYGKEDKHGCVQ